MNDSSNAWETTPVPIEDTRSPVNAETETNAHDTRILLESYGDTFTNQSKAAMNIFSIMIRRFNKPYLSWKKVPMHVRELWWMEFKNYHRWDPSHTTAIRRAWEFRCQDRMKDTMKNVRAAKGKPDWILQNVYIELRKVWDSTKYKNLGKQMSLNRKKCNGGKGVGKHTGGSLSFPEHETRMKEKQGNDYSYTQVWDSVHIVQKDGPNKGQYIDERAKETREKFDELYKEVEKSSTSSCNIDEKPLFAKAGRGKNEYIYGLGAENNRMKGVSSICSQSNQVYPDAFEKLETKVSELIEMLHDKDARIQRLEHSMEQLNQANTSLPSQNPSKTT